MDDLLSRHDQLQAGVDQDLDARRDDSSEAEIIAAVIPSTTTRSWSRCATALMGVPIVGGPSACLQGCSFVAAR